MAEKPQEEQDAQIAKAMMLGDIPADEDDDALCQVIPTEDDAGAYIRSLFSST